MMKKGFPKGRKPESDVNVPENPSDFRYTKKLSDSDDIGIQ